MGSAEHVPIAVMSQPQADDALNIRPVGFEEAIALTGYGRFNHKLLLGLWLAMASLNFVTTETAYALPAAECDLQLTAVIKGHINAAVYVGMMTTAFVWGALSDVLGRKWLLLASFVALACCSVASALVSSAWAYIACRAIAGALAIAPASLNLTYAGELFGKQYRSKVFMWAGTMQGASAALQAALAMWIIPLQLQWLRSWRVFLLTTAVLNVASALFMLLLPESPKYLAASGREREAIDVLRSIFAANTGLPPDQYPVRSLTLARANQRASGAARVNAFSSIASQFMKLWRRPYLNPLLYALAMQACILFCQNTIRMWVPQIFAQMERSTATTAADVCVILEDSRHQDVAGHAESLATTDCDSFSVDASVYLNSIVIMSSRAVVQLAASLVIRPLGDKNLLGVALVVAAAVLVAWPWTASSVAVLILACVFEGAIHTSFSATMKIIVDLFPTSVRSSAVSLSNLSGRAASVVGNVVFPILLTTKCPAAFWTGAAVLGVAALSSLVTPRPAFGEQPRATLVDGVPAKDSAAVAVPAVPDPRTACPGVMSKV